MGIKTLCKCGVVLKANEELAGKSVRCPKCNQLVDIPGSTSLPGQDLGFGLGKFDKSALPRPAETPFSKCVWEDVSKTLEKAEKAKTTEKGKAERPSRRSSQHAMKLTNSSLVMEREKSSTLERRFQFDLSSMIMRLFAICPRIRNDSGRIVASTAWRLRLLLLGTVYRQVVIDPANEKVSIRSRYLWLIRFHRLVRFSQIQAVTYGYVDESPFANLPIAGDSFDWFSVGLRFDDDSEVHLFSFIGDGTFVNNGELPDWMHKKWDWHSWKLYQPDIVGSQEKESRVFVDVLSEMIGASVVPPRNY